MPKLGVWAQPGEHGNHTDHAIWIKVRAPWQDPKMALIRMRNWVTGEEVGWWQHTGDQELERGLRIDYWPWVEKVVDGSPWMEPVPVHRHPEGYWFLRLPQGGGKVLVHRQLWQDIQRVGLEPGSYGVFEA